jgi:hypothetical protein
VRVRFPCVQRGSLPRCSFLFPPYRCVSLCGGREWRKRNGKPKGRETERGSAAHCTASTERPERRLCFGFSMLELFLCLCLCVCGLYSLFRECVRECTRTLLLPPLLHQRLFFTWCFFFFGSSLQMYIAGDVTKSLFYLHDAYKASRKAKRKQGMEHIVVRCLQCSSNRKKGVGR